MEYSNPGGQHSGDNTKDKKVSKTKRKYVSLSAKVSICIKLAPVKTEQIQAAVIADQHTVARYCKDVGSCDCSAPNDTLNWQRAINHVPENIRLTIAQLFTMSER